MSSSGEKEPLVAQGIASGDHHDPNASIDWRADQNASIFFDNRTFSSLEEMKGSLMEVCCPGDGVLSGALSLITTAATPIMLSLPLAFTVGGTSFSLVCILMAILMTFISVRIIALASVSADSYEYETVAAFFLGAKGMWIIRLIMFVYNFGCSVVFLSFIKESVTPILATKATFLPDVLRGELGGTLFLVLVMLIVAPLTFYSRLASLRTKGFVSNVFIVFIIMAVVYRFAFPTPAMKHSGEEAASPDPLPGGGGGGGFSLIPYFFVAPMFIFSYEVQSNVLAVVKDLQDRSGRKILVSVVLAIIVMTSFYVTIGYFGSKSFPDLREGNLLIRYGGGDDYLMMTCQLLCCYSASISFVFCTFPARSAAFMLISDGSTNGKIPKKMRWKLGVALSSLATVLAIFMPDVAKVVSVMGALLSSTLSMTFPSLFALKMHHSGTYLTSTADLIISWVLLAAGVASSAIGTYMAVMFAS